MCKNPLARLETYERVRLKDGRLGYVAKIDAWANVEKMPRSQRIKYHKVDMIPCGNCIECRLAKARDKTAQMVAELKNYKAGECWFITLTYDDTTLPIKQVVNTDTGEVTQGISLDKTDAQKFIKRLREYCRTRDLKIPRYVLCGEYGDTTNRPHMHAIIYGFDIPDLKFYKISDLGHHLYKSKVLNNIWAKGYVVIGAVSYDSMAYVARYMMKKQYGENAIVYLCQAKEPEFLLQSKKPPIGYNYLIDKAETIYKTDEFFVATDKNLKTQKPPKTLDRWLKINDPEKFEQIKKQRKLEAKQLDRIRIKQDNRELWEQRKASAEHLERRFKSFRKEL